MHLKHTSRQSCSVHGAFKNKVWPFVAERVIPLKELRWSRTMLTSPRAVREISRSSVLAEQGRLIAFPNVPPEKGRAERLTLRHIWRPWASFRLGWVFSSLGVCLRRKSRIAARIAGPVIILCALPGFASAQATWEGSVNSNWNEPGNWITVCSPDLELATFGFAGAATPDCNLWRSYRHARFHLRRTITIEGAKRH